MPVQAPQWTEFLLCPICTQTFEETVRRPISLGCGHTVCKMCLNKLHRKACPFDQTAISTDIEQLPVNTALLQLVGGQVRCFLLVSNESQRDTVVSLHSNTFYMNGIACLVEAILLQWYFLFYTGVFGHSSSYKGYIVLYKKSWALMSHSAIMGNPLVELYWFHWLKVVCCKLVCNQ